ncbi:DUF2203 domain-containing protein [Candidatus Dormiibacter inghamiae]|uniref:DUF2203 domain-containing protein n=1 Tax=Candidatus Dormiibacter inghamiae TaxID=3127013 RepID=UPI0030C67980
MKDGTGVRWTLEEANAALTEVSQPMGMVVENSSLLRDLRVPATGRFEGRVWLLTAGSQAREELADRAAERIETAQSALRALGVTMKDCALGLVDFESIREGRRVELCWMLGEENISYWHEADAGFSCRQPL